jgi:YVTN family beta-propeller protein
VAYNAGNGYIYVTNSFSNDVYIIDGDTVIDTVAVGNGPRGVAYNPDNGYIYLTNFNSNTVSIIGIIVPIADARPDQTVDSGTTVQLDGSCSSANGGSPIASYQWTQTSGPAVTLNDLTSATPFFTAPSTEVQEDIVFELVVTNEQGVESEPDSVTVTVNPVIPPPPPLEGIIGSANNINI